MATNGTEASTDAVETFDWALQQCRSKAFPECAAAGVVHCIGLSSRGNPLLLFDPGAIAALEKDSSNTLWPRYVLYFLQVSHAASSTQSQVLFTALNSAH